MNKLTIAALLTGAACIGVGATVVITAKCAEKAEAQGLTPFDKENWKEPECRKEMAKTYAPSLVAASATMAFAISSHMVSRKQVAAILGTAATSAALLSQYKKTTKELVGEENYSKIVREVDKKKQYVAAEAQNKIKSLGKKNPERTANSKDVTFHDYYTGMTYTTDIITQMQAENLVNMNLAIRNKATLEEYYGYMGFVVPDAFQSDFWDHDVAENWINFEHHWNEDHTICIVDFTCPLDLG